jgi:exodeoxyribonuclease V alpha subunit
MHGGVKVYRGAPSAARNYLDADRSRADDYYLTEGTGIARRFVGRSDGCVVELAALIGDGYEGWVAGLDPETGQPRGRLRADASAVRFVEATARPSSPSDSAAPPPNTLPHKSETSSNHQTWRHQYNRDRTSTASQGIT